MKTTLESKVEVWDIAVFSELAVWEPRPDLQVLCVAARDRGTLDDEVVEEVLPGLSKRGRANLLRHLAYIQLVSRNGGLTPLGRRCAAEGDAPAWEQGVYDLLVATHPLFGCHVLDYKRATNDPYDRNYDDLQPIPSWLAISPNQVFTSALDNSRQFGITGFPSSRGQEPLCRMWEMAPGKLSWDIELDSGENRWTIEGEVGSKDDPKRYRSTPQSIDPSELKGLYAKWDNRWNRRARRVLMPYDGRVGQGGREPFLRSWRYKTVNAGPFGTWEDTVVRDVPVGPRTDEDARTWATAILVARAEAVDAYLSPDGWNEEWTNAVSGTPLEGKAGEPPEPAALREVNGEPIAQRTRWLLTACAEIGLGV